RGECAMRKNEKLVRAIWGVTPIIAMTTLCGSLSAALNIYEPFNYSTGPLQGNINTSAGTTANGKAWVQAGPANPPGSINVVSGSLTGPTVLPPSLGNSVQINGFIGGDGSTNRLPLGQQYLSGTVYYSFLLDVSDLTNSNSTTGGFFFALNNSINPQTGAPGVSPGKIQARIDQTDPTKYNLGVLTNESASAGASSWATNQLSLGDTELIVGSYDVTNKVAKMWINPDPATFGLSTAPTATVSDTNAGGSFSSGIQSVLLRQSSTAPALALDELRVGSTWGDVTPTLSAYWDINADAGAGGTGSANPNGVWDGATANWNLASDGTGSTQAWLGSGYKAVFSAGTDATGAYTVTVSGTQSAAAISFEDGTPKLTGGTVNVSTGVISANSGVIATIQSTLSGNSGLLKGGAGTVVLTGASNYTGNTTINL